MSCFLSLLNKNPKERVQSDSINMLGNRTTSLKPDSNNCEGNDNFLCGIFAPIGDAIGKGLVIFGAIIGILISLFLFFYANVCFWLCKKVISLRHGLLNSRSCEQAQNLRELSCHL